MGNTDQALWGTWYDRSMYVKSLPGSSRTDMLWSAPRMSIYANRYFPAALGVGNSSMPVPTDTGASWIDAPARSMVGARL